MGKLTMPVIMMSGHATIDTAVEATKIGALNFLEKPIALQKLLKAVEQGLAHGTASPAAVSTAKPMPHANASGVPVAAALPTASALSASPEATPGGAMQGQAGQTASISFDIPLRDARDAFERAYFEYHLARENGSMTRVAEKTGLERTHLYRKLKQLGVDLGKNKSEV
jgi:DNA-binding NtrC family response regulator